MDRLAAVAYRLYGQPPGRDAPRSIRLCWIRRLYVGSVLISLPATVLLIAWGSSLALVIVAAGWVMTLLGLAQVSLQIQRARRREQASDASGPAE
jgi:uncharacterized protein (DUF58 family)